MRSALRGAILSALLLLVAFSFPPTYAFAVPPSTPSCGWNGAVNATRIVASSPVGSPVMIKIGEPSWEQACISFAGPQGSTSGYSFPEYEVFPITIQAPPYTTVNLEAGSANPTPIQVTQYGVHKGTIWTWFNPNSVVTNSSGIATSNMTLVGAVMPFVPNDLSNVSLPITASTASGEGNSTAGLPIEFEENAGGSVLVLKEPGPITFGSGMSGQAGDPSQPLFAVVYSPPNPASKPINVSLQVLGAYENGGHAGPMPSGLSVSFPTPTFELKPNSIFYVPVAQNNSLKPSNTSPSATYTLAIQESIGNATYVEPMTVTIQLSEMYASGLGPSASSLPPAHQIRLGFIVIPFGESDLLLMASAIIVAVAVIFGVIALQKRKQQKVESTNKEETSIPFA